MLIYSLLETYKQIFQDQVSKLVTIISKSIIRMIN